MLRKEGLAMNPYVSRHKDQQARYEILQSPSQIQPLESANFSAMFNDFVKFVDASPNTIRTYRTSLKQFFKYLSENNITRPTPDTLREYRQNLRQNHRPTTVQNYIIACKQFFRWSEAAHLYPNIARYIKGAKISRNFKKDYLTSQQAKRVLQLTKTDTIKGKRDYAMLAVMLTMGLRTIEVTRADVKDITNAGDNVVLFVQGKGHTDKDDAVRMPNHVDQALRDYLSARQAKPEQPLFTSTSHQNQGQRMTTRSIRRIVKNAFRRAGYDSPRLTAHSTRHTAATLSLLHGATLQQTQELLRHKNIATTEIYAHNIDVANNPASADVDKAIFG